MTVLLIDVGNTRVKWARLDRAGLGRQYAAPHAGWTSAEFASRVFRAGRGIERVVVASVAGAALERELARAAQATTGRVPELAVSLRTAAGVTTRYREPWRLGVDRFVAAIGAHRLAGRRAVCVVDVGTALTIDLVDGAGVHQGGAIVPGPELMVRSLLSHTSGILRRARGGGSRSGLFARSTRDAVEQGALHAVAAVVERAVRQAAGKCGRAPLVLLTGGAAARIGPRLAVKHRQVPDLVLRGLAELAVRDPQSLRRDVL